MTFIKISIYIYDTSVHIFELTFFKEDDIYKNIYIYIYDTSVHIFELTPLSVKKFRTVL